MTMEVEYICLREEFLSAAQFRINKNVLNTIKEHYVQDINSNRKLSQIKDLRTLLKVLEKRDTLSSNSIDPLLYISNNFLNDLQIRKKLNTYKVYLQNMQYTPSYNTYEDSSENTGEKKSETNVAEGNKSQITEPNQAENQSTLQAQNGRNMNYSEPELALQQILLSRISERIGRSWRDTVRYLGVPEYQIDAIQNKHAFDLKEQSYEALKLYISQYSTDNWQIDLLHALEKARRRDVKELVEELILGLSKHL